MADDRQPVSAPIPLGLDPYLTRVLQGLQRQASGRRGQFFGTKWRMVEGSFPSSSGPLSLLVQVLTASGWNTVDVFQASDSPGAGSTALPVYSTATRPAASSSYVNRLIVVRDGGSDDVLQWCRQLSGGGYEWKVVAY